MCKSAACLGGFSLTKAPSFAIRNSDCKIHPQRRLNDKGVSPAAACDQRRCLWKLPPFEKGGRKLYFSENRCREAASRVSRTKPIRELGAGSACRESAFLCFLSFFLKKKGSAGSARKRGPAFQLAPSCLGCFMGFGEISVYSLRRRSPLGCGWCRPPRHSPPASGFWRGCRTASSSPAPYRCCLKRCADP